MVTPYVNYPIIINSINSSNLTSVGFLIEYYIPLFSVLIAIVAFFVSFRILQVTRRHNMLSLKPHIIFRLDSSSEKGSLRLYFCNKGLGPAIIENFTFVFGRIKTAKASRMLHYLLNKLNISSDNLNIYSVYPLKTYSILPDEEKTILDFSFKLKSKKGETYICLFEKIKDVEIHYTYIDFYQKRENKVFNYRSITDYDEK